MALHAAQPLYYVGAHAHEQVRSQTFQNEGAASRTRGGGLTGNQSA